MITKKSFYTDNSQNIWSGFVDIVTNIMVVFIFLLMIFILSHFFMLVPSNKNNVDTVIKLNKQVDRLISALKNKQQSIDDLINQIKNKDYDISILNNNINSANKNIEIEESRREKLISKVSSLNEIILQMEGEIISKTNQIKEVKQNEKNLKTSIDSLNGELRKLNDVFDATDKYIKWQNIQIVELGKKLNRALANKAAELYKVRSNFFEKISVVLQDNKNFKMQGDRIIVQSELFFKSASFNIEKSGRKKLNEVAGLIKNMEKVIDKDVNWIIRIDGHTDNTPTVKGTNNWELSVKRALSVLNYLVQCGVNPKRLSATGFGEYQPIASNENPYGRLQNRRIEFKLTEK